jgi:hypothetical protein
MTSNIHLGDSSGGSNRRLRSTAARKKNLKLPLNLELLQLAPSTSSDPNPTGPIAIRDFPLDYRQPPNRKPVDSASQPSDSVQPLSKTKRRPRPDTDDDSDDSQTYSSRPPLHPSGPATSLPTQATLAQPNPTPMPTLPDYSIPSSQSPTGPPSLFFPYLWLTFSIHETHNFQLNLPVVTYTAASLAQNGMPESEIQECLSYRHSFPRVAQTLYPSSRPDTLPGQYYHLTQLPSHVDMDPTTGLSRTYQLVIRFDNNYRDFSKTDVQEAATSRFETMRIPFAARFREPICTIVDQASMKWLGFIKVDLLNPHTDGLALLRGERVFTLLIKNEYVIGKVEKGFDFNSTSSSRKIKIQSPILTRYNSRHLLAELIRLGYASGHIMEFVGVSKRTPEQDFAEITLVAEETRTYLLTSPIFLEGERVLVSTPPPPNSTQNPEEALTTSLIVKGLPMQHSQLQITAAVHRLLGARNVITVTYNRAQSEEFGRHDGIATVRCLNSAVYTH